ncbi:MAG: AtpZ/AtpI family protein [Nitrospirota bacterium]|nr:MAG: AtpZ/AtpI family protein [Nitrospirota bacterium]
MLAASQLGLFMVLATFCGLAIGYGLDSLFGTDPWLTIIFLLIGIATGFYELFRFARKQSGSNG